MSDAWRPDRIGIVVTEAGTVSVGLRLLPVVTFQEDLPGTLFRAGGAAVGGREADAEAARLAAGREMLDHFLSRGVAVMIIQGSEARIEFDRSRYPGISAADIEAALRYEPVAGCRRAETAGGRRRRLSAA